MKLNVCAMHTMHCVSWLSFQYNNEKQHFSFLYNKGGHAVICTVFLL